MPLKKVRWKYVFLPGYGNFQPGKKGFTKSIEHPHWRSWWHRSRFRLPSTRLLLLVGGTLGLHVGISDWWSRKYKFLNCLTCISAFFWEADLPAFSCCLVFLGGLPAASASFFFWLLDLGGMASIYFYLKKWVYFLCTQNKWVWCGKGTSLKVGLD